MKTSSKKTSATTSSTKREVRRRRQQRNQIMKMIAIAGVFAVLAIVILVNLNNQDGSSMPVEGVQSFPNLERGHTSEPVKYSQIPPVGGVHNPVWQNCGVYTQPIANENGVHSLEHGAIWITYRPDLPASEVQKLQTFTRESGYRLLSPYPDLPGPIMLSAWGYQLQLEQADEQRLMAFVQKYEQNPGGPEPGAPCTGGLGQPG